MKLMAGFHWVFAGGTQHNVDPHLFTLLDAIYKNGSLQRACTDIGLSYRHAWGVLKKWENQFHTPLVRLERGRGKGATLTDLGDKLLWADQHFRERLRPLFEEIEQDVNESFVDLLPTGKHPRTRLLASHGMAISLFQQLMQTEAGIEIDFQTRGSLDSLENLSYGHCEMAGFHIPLQSVGATLAPRYTKWISDKKHTLMIVAVREQGLLCKKGNPRKITSLKDLTRRSIRFINRQPHSGTRTIFDQLLLQEGIDPAAISGYKNEEFTHVAVAAMVASGAVNAGFGIKAVIGQFDLDFVPFLQEAYVLAIDKQSGRALSRAARSILKSAHYQAAIKKLPGYDATLAGEAFTFDLTGSVD